MTRIIVGVLPLPLASPSASSGSFVVGQDDRGKEPRRGTAKARALIRNLAWPTIRCDQVLAATSASKAETKNDAVHQRGSTLEENAESDVGNSPMVDAFCSKQITDAAPVGLKLAQDVIFSTHVLAKPK